MTEVSSGDLFNIKPQDLKRLSPDRFRALASMLLETQQKDRQEFQLLYYQPVSAAVMKAHESKAKVRGVFGGNGSSKTESQLAELVAKATGVFPKSLAHLKEQKFRGPINCRVVCESMLTVLEPIILPKMQFWKWTGLPPQGGDKGHWGWIPQSCLRDGSWDRSWSSKLSTLTVLCRDPDDIDKVLGESIIQFMSHNQDPSDFASGDYHETLLDEPPPMGIWRETQARAMRVDGNITLAMTWPDDPQIAVDWIFDEIYEPAKAGSSSIECFELHTTDNKTLDQESIRRQMENWSEETVAVRIFGRPIRFSNLIHPEFTDLPKQWCFTCGKETFSVIEGRCSACASTRVSEICHVQEFEIDHRWPTIFALDPHPRKPHMWMHVAVDPSDDLWVVNVGELDSDPFEVKTAVYAQENELGLQVAQRLMDPNMGRSPSSAKSRETTWQDEFDEGGLRCDLASDSDVGRARINEFLKPDPHRMQPRVHFHPRCAPAIHQMKRYSWDEYRMRQERGVKEKPREKYDDYPTLLKYILNSMPTFEVLSEGAGIIETRKRHGRRSR